MKSSVLAPWVILPLAVLSAGCASEHKSETARSDSGSDSASAPASDSAPAPASASPTMAIDDTLPALSSQELGMWLMEYYLHPDPDHLIPRAAQLCVLAASTQQTARPTSVFVSELIRANPLRVEKWAAEISKQPGGRVAVCEGFWLSCNAKAQAAVKRIVPQLPKAEQETVLAMLQGTPEDTHKSAIAGKDLDSTMTNMDANWAAFFATGQAWPVERVYALLIMDKADMSAAELEKSKAVALWSLGSISQMQPKLAEHAKAKLATLPPDVRAKVEASLASGGRNLGEAP